MQASGVDASNAWQTADASTLNNLGNTEVALGLYEDADRHFRAAQAQQVGCVATRSLPTILGLHHVSG
jgi:hypothetical protein